VSWGEDDEKVQRIPLYVLSLRGQLPRGSLEPLREEPREHQKTFRKITGSSGSSAESGKVSKMPYLARERTSSPRFDLNLTGKGSLTSLLSTLQIGRLWGYTLLHVEGK